jgi:hypothetical protein
VIWQEPTNAGANIPLDPIIVRAALGPSGRLTTGRSYLGVISK